MSGADPRLEEIWREADRTACARALKIGNPTRRTVVAILRNNLEQLPLDDAPEISAPIVVHDNVRGGDYFDLNEDNDKS